MNAALERRLAALETTSTGTRPLLFIGRADLDDESDGIGFAHCPLVRESGEAWADFKGRFAAWSQAQPAMMIGHIVYRKDNDAT